MPFLTLTERGVISEINVAGAALLGVTRGHLVDRPFLFFVESAHQSRLLKHLRLCRMSRKSCSVELHLRGADKGPFPVELSSNPTLSDLNGKLRIQSVIFDLSERKRAEAERERLYTIQTSERLLRSVLGALPVGVRVYDRDGRLVMTNATSEAIWKNPALPLELWGTLAARHVRDGRHLASDDWPVKRVLATGAAVLNELIELKHGAAQSQTGSCFLHESAVALRGEGGAIDGVVAVTTDVTDSVQAESRLLAAKETAEAASRVKDEFLAVASHELRTPISAVLLWVHLLKSGMNDTASRTEAISMIDQNAHAQAKLINDLLDVSRMINGKMSVNLAVQRISPILLSSIDSVRPSAQARKIALDVAVVDPEMMVAVDADRLQLIFWNLLTNAIKFTPDNGSVRIELRRFDSRAQVIVVDTGIGITRAFLPFVFERFRQADSTFTRQYSGLDLGLSITRQLVEMHGGTIEADSPGRSLGTTMTVNLPLAAASEVEAAYALRKTAVTNHSANITGVSLHLKPLKGFRILIVEDEEMNRLALRHLLRQAGAAVTATADGAGARKAFAKSLKGKGFHILLSDISMPDEDGYEVMRSLRKMESAARARRDSSKKSNGQAEGLPHGIPAIALTALPAVDYRPSSQKAGFNMRIIKPIEPDHLISSIIELVKRNQEDPTNKTGKRIGRRR